MKNNSWLWLFMLLSIFSILLILGKITLWVFLGLCGIWIIGFLILAGGPETISEISIWKTSIKRDVKAARQIRHEIEKIYDELKNVVKLTAENSFILGSSSFLAMGGDSNAKKRLEKNIQSLSDFVEPLEEAQDIWWDELHNNTFPDRYKNK